MLSERAKSLVREKISSLTTDSEIENDGLEPSPKRPCTGLWKSFSDILEEAGASVSNESGSQKLDAYLAEPLITFGRESCYNWWANNRHRFPSLTKIARQYLHVGAPPTSVLLIKFGGALALPMPTKKVASIIGVYVRLREKISSLTTDSEIENDGLEPSPKRPCTGLWKSFSDILEEAGASVSNESGSQKLDAYLAEPLITFGRESCYNWWANNRHRFPSLAKIARQYLCAPPTSVASERLFSGAGEIYNDRRSRLAPEKAEMLLIIKYNFPLHK